MFTSKNLQQSWSEYAENYLFSNLFWAIAALALLAMLLLFYVKNRQSVSGLELPAISAFLPLTLAFPFVLPLLLVLGLPLSVCWLIYRSSGQYYRDLEKRREAKQEQRLKTLLPGKAESSSRQVIQHNSLYQRALQAPVK